VGQFEFLEGFGVTAQCHAHRGLASALAFKRAMSLGDSRLDFETIVLV
jgi:hypothetical protein